MSSVSVRSLPFLSFIMPISAWAVPLTSLSFLKRSLVLLILLFYCFPLFLCIAHYLSLLFSGTLHSVGCIFPFLLCLSFLFFPQLFLKPPQTSTLPFCIYFSWGWFWSQLPEQYYKPQYYKPLPIVPEALCLPDLILKSTPSLYNHKGFDLDHTWMV